MKVKRYSKTHTIRISNDLIDPDTGEVIIEAGTPTPCTADIALRLFVLMNGISVTVYCDFVMDIMDVFDGIALNMTKDQHAAFMHDAWGIC